MAHASTRGLASRCRGSPARPVVGMVGAGQLARMTAPAAVGLGHQASGCWRRIADESAAQVCADTVLGDHRSTDDLLAFAAGCDVVTFDHEHVPQQQLRALEAGRARGAAGRRRAALCPGQAGHAGAAEPGSACHARGSNRSPAWPT